MTKLPGYRVRRFHLRRYGPFGRIHFLDGSAADPDAECRRYEAEIERAGGIDFQVLGIGTNGYVLTVVAGAPAWAANPAGFADPLTTRGDLIVRGGSGTTRLALGATGAVLTSNGIDATWAAAGAAPVDYLTPIWWDGD